MILSNQYYLKRALEKFSSIKFLPLDLTLTTEEKTRLLDMWEKHSGYVQRLSLCSSCNRDTRIFVPESCCLNYYHWKGLSVMGDFGFNPVFDQPKILEYPEWLENLYSRLLKMGPFKTISHIWLWSSLRAIIPHRELDGTNNFDLPLILRGMLFDENKRDSFYIYYGKEVAGLQSEFKEKLNSEYFKYISLPEKAQFFSWNNYRCLHGSDYCGRKKILIAVNGEYCYKKYIGFMDRSIKKYRSFVDYI